MAPSDRDKRYPKPDGKYTFDKLSGVFLTGNATRDDAPSHIRIQKRVPREVAEAWACMCPAGVYEIPEDAPENGQRRPDREPVELRAVRRDHRQGRPPDPARGRRRPHVPDHVARIGTLGRCLRRYGEPMHRLALIVTGVLLALCPPPRRPPRPATVTLTACTPKERTAEFEARMDQVSGAVRMKLRYTLEARKPGRLWRRVAAPELGGWRSAALETTRFISERRVTQLVGPSSYRALVRFRWIDEDGHVVARARARSHSCWQPDHRPNLKLRELSFEGEGSYVVLVANTGRSPIRRLRPRARPALAPIVVGDLAPGEERLIEAVGPACEPGTVVTATADPLDLIDERNERDNAVSRRCPSARAS